jgi:hypothetical protein
MASRRRAQQPVAKRTDACSIRIDAMRKYWIFARVSTRYKIEAAIPVMRAKTATVESARKIDRNETTI